MIMGGHKQTRSRLSRISTRCWRRWAIERVQSRIQDGRGTLTSTKVYDAIVVGAGIVGMACAKQLVDAGMRVAVCEQHEYAGGGATAAGMGHIAVMDDSEAQFQLTRYSQKLWHELSDELPVTAEYINCGSMWVAADESEMDEVRRKF